MARKIAINGFGRIGRLAFRNLMKDESVEVVAINDLTDNATLAHLLKYDSAHGQFNGTVSSDDTYMTVNGKQILATAERDPSKLPWKELDVDVVLECTGVFRTKDKASLHLEAGAKKVILSAPAKGGDVKTVVIGVNDNEIQDDIQIYSNASCTTNCLAPVVKVLDENYGIVSGMMTTIHAYTANQNIQDGPHSDLRRARACAYNMIPTSTGAAKAVSLVYPNIGQKIQATAVRVPIITGSIVDLVVKVEKQATAEEINEVFRAAAAGPLDGVLMYCTDPIVSSDIVGNQYSSIFDAELTNVNGDLVNVVSWYDNEAGYAARLSQLATMV